MSEYITELHKNYFILTWPIILTLVCSVILGLDPGIHTQNQSANKL